MISSWTKDKFLSLPLTQQHKKASELLREIFLGKESRCFEYHLLCEWMGLPILPSFSQQPLSDRFHEHLKQSDVSWQEHNLLIVRQLDKPTKTPFLPIAIYLDNLRSAFNVGSILRCTEAFRLGTVYFSQNTPFIDHPKVQKTSMGTFDQVPCLQIDTIHSLPRPFIGLETVDSAPSVWDFSYPSEFTLFLGNEEYGLSSEILKILDFVIQIPLCGGKNSLNVASAFAITASAIRHKATPLL